jgi:hypothetical protein
MHASGKDNARRQMDVVLENAVMIHAHTRVEDTAHSHTRARLDHHAVENHGALTENDIWRDNRRGRDDGRQSQSSVFQLFNKGAAVNLSCYFSNTNNDPKIVVSFSKMLQSTIITKPGKAANTAAINYIGITQDPHGRHSGENVD